MKLELLVDFLRERLKHPLPGVMAHDMMRATPVGPITPDFRHQSPPKPGAVLIHLYQDGTEIKFPLIKRQEYLGAHSGQISLPGGKAEADENAVQTALREGREEIGIEESQLQVLGVLSDFFVIPSNFLVTPVVVSSLVVPQLNPDPREVARILTGNILQLTQQDAIRNKEILAGGKFRMMAPHFEIEGEIVWGATAMILNELCHLVREGMKSDH
jgi:8-oxo-dGTP pyrophosphatase MutT (NUDIX family)